MADHKLTYQQPEGALIESALKEKGLSQRQLAKQVELSEGRVRQVINGYKTEAGQVLGIVGKAETVARLARAAGVTIDQMTQTGRNDVVDVMEQWESNQITAPKGRDPLGLQQAADVAELVTTVRALVERVERIEQQLQGGGGERGGDTPATTTPDSGPAGERVYLSAGSGKTYSFLALLYLERAEGDLEVAIRLLAHDGAKGAGVDEDVWDAALRALLDQQAQRAVVSPRDRLRPVADGGSTDQDEIDAAEAQAAAERAKSLEAIEEMKRKKGE